MAMHLHASFSEGTASYESHLWQARRLGVDVLWWTDHDFRVAAHGYRRAVRFDGPVETEAELDWTWSQEREGNLRSGGGDFVDEPHTPDEPGRALRLHARSLGPDPATVWFRGTAWNWTYSTCLADTTVELDVLPEQLGEGAVFIVEIEGSHHPAAGGRPAGQYRLHYRVGGFPARRHVVAGDGLLGIVECPAPAGRWHRLRMRPVEDIAALWPDLVAADNSLYQLRLGVRSAGGEASAVVDRLRFDRTERAGGDSLALRRRVLEGYADRFADLRHYEALEMSLTRHLNWFGGDLAMPDFGAGPPLRDWDVDTARAMVDYLHGHQALVSYNHPMEHDVANPTDLARLILRTDALGADIVELGHKRQLEDLLEVLDVAARNACFFTGTGVSDDHAGADWIDQRINYLTQVWSRSVELPDLRESLRGGRAWFADPGAWRGTLDTRVAGARAMGGVIRIPGGGGQPRCELGIDVTDLPRGGALEIVTGPVDRPGPDKPEAATNSRAIPSRDLSGNSYGFALGVDASGQYVRAQVRDAGGSIVGVGNPTWLLPEAVAEQVEVPADRHVPYSG